MNTDNDFNFLKTETEELGTALFYNFSNALLKFPTSIIQLSKFDEEGNVWFQMQKPYQEIEGMDKTFASQLNFYKKGCSNYITLTGTAAIAAEEITGTVTIRFKISNAECFYVNIKTSSFLINFKNSAHYFLKSFYRDEPNHFRFGF